MVECLEAVGPSLSFTTGFSNTEANVWSCLCVLKGNWAAITVKRKEGEVLTLSSLSECSGDAGT